MSKKTAKKHTTTATEFAELYANKGITLFKEKGSKTYSAKVFNEEEEKYLTFDTAFTRKNEAMEYALQIDERVNYKYDNAIEEEGITERLRKQERTICNGNVLLFRRTRSRKWQCKVRRFTGHWKDYTTGTEDFEEAKVNAEEIFRDLKYRQESGKVDITKKFSDVCEVAKRQLLAEYKRTGRAQVKDKVRVIDKYLIPVLGKYNTHNITYEVLLEFDEKRTQIAGRELSTSAIRTHNSALNYVFQLAKTKNYLVEVPSLPTTNGRKKKDKRLHFTNEEYRKLCNFMWRDLEKSKKLINTSGFDIRSYEIREILRDIVLILTNTGIRAGNELLRLKWNDIEILGKKGEEQIQFNLIETKTGEVREVISYEPERKNETDKRSGSWSALERIRDRIEDTKGLSWKELTEKDLHIFRLPSSKQVVRQEALTKNFKKLLQRCNLIKKNKADRVLYSLRHTYASRRRYNGITYDDLAEQMGTSVELLKKVYSHFQPAHKAKEFSGQLAREKKRKEETAEAQNRKLAKQVEMLLKEVQKLTSKT
jgi:hypothetical protein